MRQIRVLLLRVVRRFRGDRRDRELADELDAHVALQTTDNLRAGMTPGAARRQALMSVGGLEVTITKERCRDLQWGSGMIFTDLWSAWRSLRRKRAFSYIVVAEMALTIGACTAIFSIVNAVLLTRLPYMDADRLVIIWHTQQNAAGVVGMAPQDYEAYRDTTRSFQSVAAVSTRGYNLSNGADPSRVVCGRVTSTAFPMLGVAPLRGRWFSVS
jgi:macrolide transport system ATP-binding/permease protein